MVDLLEQLFDGNLDEQKYALIELLRRSTDALEGTTLDTPAATATAPRPLEILEVECIARLPILPPEPIERERWKRLRDARREWLYGNLDTWTGAMQTVEVTRQGKVDKGRGAQRAKLLVSACETMMTWWLDNLQAALISAAESDSPGLLLDDV